MKHVDYLTQSRNFLKLLLALFLITIIRIYFLYNSNFDLSPDEAQYYSWSQDLQFGYYSKPPMIAWFIALSTKIFGSSEAGIRIFSPILHFFISIIIYALAKRLFDFKTSIYAALIYITLPAVTLSSSLMTTDPILLFFWALSIYVFYLAVSTNKISFWIGGGVVVGLGILSKYNMVLFFPSAILYLYLLNNNFEFLKNKNIYLAAIIAFLIYLPNFLWNANNGFVSYLHTKDISQIDKQLFHPKKMVEFILLQIAMCGPILFYQFIKSFKDFKGLIKLSSYQLAFSFYVIFLALILILSLISNAYGNWAAPIYITVTLWVTAYCLKASKEFNIVISILFYSYPSLEPNLAKYNVPDPYQRIRGWKTLGTEINEIAKNHPNAVIVSDDRKTLAELIYYMKLKSGEYAKWNITGSIHNHYDLTCKYTASNNNVIMVAKSTSFSAASVYFKKSTQIKQINIPIGQQKSLKYDVYYFEEFKGI
jgi:4-amino-4-deoxy-L-arabinose transferase-like glycosyltransferase